MQGAAGFEGLLPTVVGVLPLQTVFDELLGFGILTFCIQYEVSSHLILHSCGERMCFVIRKERVNILLFSASCSKSEDSNRNSRIETTRLRMDFEMLGCGMFSLLPTCR